MVVIGGPGRLLGSVVGAALLVLLPEALRLLGLPNALAANLRQILYAAAVLAFLAWRPQGIIGEYTGIYYKRR
jgi:branched-chain amino acid transport system permease protein